eukprot:scaffold291767_cov28-Tisochrysis_lutea.AAC.3
MLTCWYGGNGACSHARCTIPVAGSPHLQPSLARLLTHFNHYFPLPLNVQGFRRVSPLLPRQQPPPSDETPLTPRPKMAE